MDNKVYICIVSKLLFLCFNSHNEVLITMYPWPQYGVPFAHSKNVLSRLYYIDHSKDKRASSIDPDKEAHHELVFLIYAVCEFDYFFYF